MVSELSVFKSKNPELVEKMNHDKLLRNSSYLSLPYNTRKQRGGTMRDELNFQTNMNESNFFNLVKPVPELVEDEENISPSKASYFSNAEDKVDLRIDPHQMW